MAFTKEYKKYLFGDWDGDKIKNIDDADPLNSSSETVEETKFSDELKDFQKNSNSYRSGLNSIVKKIKTQGYNVKFRIKGTYSTINKLKNKYVDKLGDIGGAAILLKSMDEMQSAMEFVENNFDVVKKEHVEKDLYYDAMHYDIQIGEKIYELKIMTAKQFKVYTNKEVHSRYKRGTLTEAFNQRVLAELAELNSQ